MPRRRWRYSRDGWPGEQRQAKRESRFWGRGAAALLILAGAMRGAADWVAADAPSLLAQSEFFQETNGCAPHDDAVHPFAHMA